MSAGLVSMLALAEDVNVGDIKTPKKFLKKLRLQLAIETPPACPCSGTS